MAWLRAIMLTLAVEAGAVVNMGAGRVEPTKTDGFDVRVVADGVDGVLAAMHHVQHAWGIPALQRQFAQAHGHHRVCSEGLSTKVLPCGNGHGNIHSGIMAGKLKGVMPGARQRLHHV